MIAAVLNLATNQWIIKSASEVQRGDLSKLFYQMGHDGYGLSCEKIHVCNQDDANPDFSYYPEIGVIVQFYESHQILGAHARQRIGRAKNRLFPSGHEPNSCSTLISDSNSGYRRAIASDV